MGIFRVIKRELNIIWHDSDLKLMLIAAPLFYSLFYASIYMFKMEVKVPVAVIDMDRSSVSRELVKNLDAHQKISILYEAVDLSKAEEMLREEKCEGVIFIPPDFEKDIINGKGTSVKLYLNTQRFLHSNDLNKAVNEVIIAEAEMYRTKIYLTQRYSIQQAKGSSDPVRSNIQLLFNPSESYGDFLIPAVLLLIIQQTLFMALGQSTAKENESSTQIELYNICGKNILSMLSGKVFIYVVFFSVYCLFFFTINTSLFSVSFNGSKIAFFTSCLLGVISISLLAVLAGSFFTNKINALAIISLTSYPLFFLSGYAWPPFAMPEIIKIISWFIPITPLMTITSLIVQMSGSWSNILYPLLHLCLLILFYYGMCLIRIKFLLKNTK